jgi:peroxiredoxin
MPYLKSTAEPQTDIYFEDSGGSGQPVVLIHGWPLSHRMWESQVNALTAAGYRCVTYDRRGFGQSGNATGGYDYDTFASDLNDLLTEQNLTNVVLVGFSMGGGEVARYIGRYGEGRVAKAVLAGAVTPFLLETDDNPDGVDRKVFDGMLAAVTEDRINFLADFFPTFFKGGLLGPKASDDAILHAKTIAWRASPLGTQRCIVAFGTTDFRADLQRFTVPTLVVHGDSDAIVPFDKSGKRVPEFVAHAKVATLGGAPHGFTATHSDKFNELLLDFLKS